MPANGSLIGFGRAHRDSTECVDDAREATEPDLGVVVQAQSGRLLDGLRQQRGAAERERRVDLVGAVVGNRHVGVPGNRDHRRRGPRTEPRHVYQQDGVGAAVAEVAAGGQVGLLILGESFAAVGADQQPSGAAAGGRPVGIVGEDRDAMQRPVGPHPGSDDSADGHEQQHQDDSSDGWPSPLAAHRCRRGCLGRWRLASGRLGRGWFGCRGSGPPGLRWRWRGAAARDAGRPAPCGCSGSDGWWGRRRGGAAERSGTPPAAAVVVGRPDRGGSPAAVHAVASAGEGTGPRARGSRGGTRRSSLTRTIYGLPTGESLIRASPDAGPAVRTRRTRPSR